MKSTRPKNVSKFFSPAVNQNRSPDQVRAQPGIPCLRRSTPITSPVVLPLQAQYTPRRHPAFP